MIWSSAISRELETKDALKELLPKLKAGLKGEKADVLFAFVSPHHSDEYAGILEALKNEFGDAPMIGCSGGGIIGEGREIEDRPAISLTAASLPGVRIVTKNILDEALPNPDSAPGAWERLLGVEAKDKPHFLILISHFMGNSDELLSGLDYAFPHSHKIGGIASGLRGIGERALFKDHEKILEGAVVMCLSGDLEMDTLVAQGCRGVGKIYTITECEQNMLLELDGRPALKVLTEIYEEASSEERVLMNRALFVGLFSDPLIPWPPKHGDFLIRDVLGIDAAKRSIAIGAELRAGQALRFHLRDAEAAAQDLKTVLESHQRQQETASAAGALLFSCQGRGEGMYGSPDHDSRVFQEHFGEIAMGGFFCNGEIGPVGNSTYVHSFTSSFGIFRPRNEKEK